MWTPQELALRQETEAIFMTNQCTEVAHASKQLFDILCLPHSQWDNDFYPLDEHDRQFIREDGLPTNRGGLVLTGYAGLYKGKLWDMPCIEEEPPGDSIDKEIAAIQPAIENAGGLLLRMKDVNDFLQILIPIQYVTGRYADFESWKVGLDELLV